jgi:glycosyltransferase involved in cell wall biosynthesis
MLGRLLFDMTGQLQWYAHRDQASGIQRVTEHLIGSNAIRSFSHVEFVFRPLGSEMLYRLDPSIVFDLVDEYRRAFAIGRFRGLTVRSSRLPPISDYAREARPFDLMYWVAGMFRLEKLVSLWNGARLGKLYLEPIRPPSAADTFLNTGDFWCHPGYARSVVSLKRNTGVTIALVLHDLFYLDNPDWNHPRFADFGRQLDELAPHIDVWMPTSRYVESQLRSYLASRPSSRCSIRLLPMGWGTLPVGTEPTLLESGDVLRKFSLTPGQYFLAVGKVEPRRNYLGLLDALLVARADSNATLPRCVIVGQDGWRSREFKDRLREMNDGEKSVQWLKSVTDRELSILYRNARFCVIPSMAEGWGLPIRESLAHGTPCLASTVGGASEAGGDLAEYFDPLQPNEFASILRRWLIDDNWVSKARARINARALRTSRTSWDAAGNAIVEV